MLATEDERERYGTKLKLGTGDRDAGEAASAAAALRSVDVLVARGIGARGAGSRSAELAVSAAASRLCERNVRAGTDCPMQMLQWHTHVVLRERTCDVLLMVA